MKLKVIIVTDISWKFPGILIKKLVYYLQIIGVIFSQFWDDYCWGHFS